MRVPRVEEGGEDDTPSSTVIRHADAAASEDRDHVVNLGGRIEQYELIRPLGRGGMGTVYLARDTRLGRLVAIKLVRNRRFTSAERFRLEARATARCIHENIVVIHDIGEQDGYLYMVLEYLAGLSLKQWLERRARNASTRGMPGDDGLPPTSWAPLPVSRAVEMVTPVVRALVCAHSQGIVHRDLKPSNIMMTDTGVIKVLDFGVAKLLEVADDRAHADAWPISTPSELTMAGKLVGSALYMSPEQWSGGDIDDRSDLWAIGVVLYELVTGRHPLRVAAESELKDITDLSVPVPSVTEVRPDIGRLGSIIDRCLIKRRADRIGSARELLGELESLLPAARRAFERDDEGPYTGLIAFQEDDADRFYGRGRDVAAAVARLNEQPLLAIVGPSGAGKSSFVRAGLVPALKRSGEAWEALALRPGRHPLAALAALLADPVLRTSDTGSDPADEYGAVDRDLLIRRLRAQPGLLGTRLRSRARRKLCRTLLFVDQFEELYTLGADADERQAFAACLEAAADDPGSPARVVLSIRSDFLDRVTETQPLMNVLARGMVLLPPIARAGLHEVLTRPLEGVGYQFESDTMVEDMLDALDRTHGALPLLQFTAAKLWEQRDRQRHLLTMASYRAIGGVAGTLATHADAVLASMSAADQALTRQIFERLVTPERTRALASVDELRELARDRESAERVLTRLVEARLLIIEADAEREGATAELVHESLIERWPTLSRWLGEHQDDAAFLARVRAAAREWRASDRPQGLLWRDDAMLEARRWRRRSTAALGPAEAEFLDAVFALARHEQRRRRISILVLVLALVLVAAAMSYLAFRERRASERARDQAERARTAAGDAQREAGHARDAARLASARGRQSDPTLVLALLREVEDPAQLPSWPELAARAFRAPLAEAVLTGHEGILWTVDLSPDDRRIAVASADDAWLWNTDGSGTPVVLRGHSGPVWQATFSADGTHLVTSSWDRTARIWTVDGSRPPVVLEHPDRLSWAAFSPDGGRVVTASWDSAAWIWRSDGTGAPIVLRGHSARIRRALFSPDGRRVVTTSFDNTARLWNADSAGAPIVLAGHDGPVWTAAFSPDGTRVVTASNDGTARIWTVDGSRPPIVLRGHTGWVMTVAFSSDGRRVVTGSADDTARVWNADGSGTPIVLAGHRGDVPYAAFDGDGTHVLTASADATARLWQVDGSGTSIVLTGHERGLSWAAMTRDGRHVVTVSGDRTARIWATRQDEAPRTLSGLGGAAEIDVGPDGAHLADAWPDAPVVEVRRIDGTGAPVLLRGATDRIRRVEISPDGQRVVAASNDGIARVWPIGGGPPIALRGHSAPIVWATFSLDGTRIATASKDGTARVWRSDGAGAPVVLRGHTTGVNRALFGPDGTRVVTTADEDSTARLWDARNGTELAILRGHTNKLHWAEISPDGTRIATCSADNTARIWRADDPTRSIVLDGHTHEVRTVHFSPDGTRVVTAADDGTVRVWSVDGVAAPVVLRGSAAPFMATARFSPDGSHVLTASDEDARVWRADGTGTPLVLDHHTAPVHDALFSPDATRVVTTGSDGTILFWSGIHDLPSLDALQDRLWAATSFCMPVDMRREMLGVSEDMARADLERCRRQVAAHATTPRSPSPSP